MVTNVRNVSDPGFVGLATPNFCYRRLGTNTLDRPERYAHLAPKNLRKAVRTLENRSRFGHVGSSDLNDDAREGVVTN